uniref:Uncharacterized protein n=1 Tax=Vitis vinifera TaxID=29760 RepID=A5BIC9_VITVI|nr:hypothetical protein VITISV_037485 [Vitis vinifera]
MPTKGIKSNSAHKDSSMRPVLWVTPVAMHVLSSVLKRVTPENIISLLESGGFLSRLPEFVSNIGLENYPSVDRKGLQEIQRENSATTTSRNTLAVKGGKQIDVDVHKCISGSHATAYMTTLMEDSKSLIDLAMFETTSSANSMYQAEPFFPESIGLVDFEDDFTTYSKSKQVKSSSNDVGTQCKSISSLNSNSKAAIKYPLFLILYQHQAVNGMTRTQKTTLSQEMQVSRNEELPTELGKNRGLPLPVTLMTLLILDSVQKNTSTSLLSSTEHTSRGGRSGYQMEWGNLAMRIGEESTDCPNVSKITHRYVPDSQESLQHCRACQEVGVTAVTSNLCT